LQDLQDEEICDNWQNTTTEDYEFIQPIRAKRNLKKVFEMKEKMRHTNL